MSDLERARSLWIGGSLSRDVGRHLALDAEVTWAREPAYRAYVQRSFGDFPYRGYAADDRVSTITTAGLLRAHAWRGKASTIDVVSGFGWAHERRASHLESIVFRPGQEPPPTYTFDISDNRDAGAAIVGVDAETSGPALTVFGECRVHFQLSGDAERSDLDLGRQIVRFGAGIRVRF